MNTKPFVSIDEIIKKLNDVEYNYQTDKQKETQDKKIKNSNQKSIENIKKTIEIIKNLDDIIENDKFIREKKIRNIYDLLKLKFDNEIYFIYVLFISNCIKINEGQKKIKRSSSTIYLLELFFEDLDLEANNLLSEPNYKLLNNLFEGNIENNFNIIIQALIKIKNNDEIIFHKNIAYIYLYIILKYKNLFNFNEGIFIIENMIMSQLADYENLDKENYLLKFLPNIFIDSNLKTKARKYINYYFKSQLDELNKIKNYQLNQIIINNNLIQNLNDKVKESSDVININKKLIIQLELQNKEKSKLIESNKLQLKQLIDRLEFEKNRADKQNIDLKKSIFSNIQNNIQIEIEELNNFAENLNKNDSEILKKILDNINQSLKSI